MAAKIVIHPPVLESTNGLFTLRRDIVIEAITIPVNRIHGHFPKFCRERGIRYLRDDRDQILLELTVKHDADKVGEEVLAELRQIHAAAVNEV